MKILSAGDIRRLDEITIKREPIRSIDLMERASKAFVKKFKQLINPYESCVHIICGPGNNGGDALAIARILCQAGIDCYAYSASNQLSKDLEINYTRFSSLYKSKLKSLESFLDIEDFNDQDILIDGLFGSGLNRKLEGIYKAVVHQANSLFKNIISIDIPSGMSCDLLLDGPTIKATQTISFQVPKLAFFLPENLEFIGKVHIIPIGLNPDFIENIEVEFKALSNFQISNTILKRNKNAHKQSIGKALLIAGSRPMMGAAILAAKSCMRGGIGLLTAHLPRKGIQTMQIAVPEVICSEDLNESIFSSLPDLKSYNGIGIGCGIGLDPLTEDAFIELLINKPASIPLIIDADALNILAKSSKAQAIIPSSHCILTPHIGEFNRLFGSAQHSKERLQKLKLAAKQFNATIILKGPNTAIAAPAGHIYFNTTGNPGMATAGSGDVLTGLILSFIAQGYSNINAALLAVYLHGLSGDLASEEIGEQSLMAGDLIEYLPKAFKSVG